MHYIGNKPVVSQAKPAILRGFWSKTMDAENGCAFVGPAQINPN
jgi:hypothetical protein